MAFAIESVSRSAYMMTLPRTLRAARPMVWTSDRSARRKPSLSASRMPTSDTSGRSRPSRNRLIPTRTSNSPSPQLAQDLDALERVDVGVKVSNPHPELAVVLREVLGHLLRQRRDENAIAHLDPLANLSEQVVDLAAHGADFDHRIQKAGGANDLLDHHTLGALQLVFRRCGRHEDCLPGAGLPLVEAEGAVVHRRREPEPEVDQRLLARTIAFEHGAHLRHGLVRFVHEHQKIFGEVVEQGGRRLSRARPERCRE